MSVEVITQVVTLGLAVFAIIWHQQRTIDKLRDEFTQAIDKLRVELTQAIDKLRVELTHAIDKLRGEVVEIGQRLARTEGFLGIGMPADASSPETSPPEPDATPPSDAPDPAVETATSA